MHVNAGDMYTMLDKQQAARNLESNCYRTCPFLCGLFSDLHWTTSWPTTYIICLRRGALYVDPLLKVNGSYPDTYLSLANGWSRGLAWINGFNLVG